MLIEVKLVDGLLKFKQRRVYVRQNKLRLLVLKEKNYNPIVNNKVVSRRYYWSCINEDKTHFVKSCGKC